jgi:predicted nuclease of predicted toxin-antitoxin system
MGIRFFIDENLGRDLANALSLLQYDVEHLLDRFPEGTKDVVWLEYVGRNKLPLITKDKQIRKRPNEKALLIKYRVVAFYLGGSERSVQDIAKQLMKAWGKMEAEARRQFKKNIAGAFIVRPGGGKIERIPLD